MIDRSLYSLNCLHCKRQRYVGGNNYGWYRVDMWLQEINKACISNTSSRVRHIASCVARVNMCKDAHVLISLNIPNSPLWYKLSYSFSCDGDDKLLLKSWLNGPVIWRFDAIFSSISNVWLYPWPCGKMLPRLVANLLNAWWVISK